MSDVANMWMMAGYIVFCACLFYLMARVGKGESDHPQMFLGIKTSTTTKSPEHWYAAHRAARGTMLTGASALLLTVPMMITVGYAVDMGTGFAVGLISTLACIIIIGGIALVIGERAARRVPLYEAE